MILANIAYDLQLLSEGRFILGLGSQIKPHIERRFSMPWSSPAKRMKEMVLAIKAIWEAWENGTKLDFKGEFYKLKLPSDPVKTYQSGGPLMYFGGYSDDGLNLCAEFCDVYLICLLYTSPSPRDS